MDGCHAARTRANLKLWEATGCSSTLRRIDNGKTADQSASKKPKTKCAVYKDDYLRFVFDLSLPFTNKTERDLGMFKVNGKINSCSI